MSNLGDRLRELARRIDEGSYAPASREPLLGISLVIVGDRECCIGVPDDKNSRSDPERAMMMAGLQIYQATNMKPSGDTRSDLT